MFSNCKKNCNFIRKKYRKWKGELKIMIKANQLPIKYYQNKIDS